MWKKYNIHTVIYYILNIIQQILHIIDNIVHSPKCKNNSSTMKAFTTTTRYHHSYPMDTDSQSIGIDNRASACISHKASDFIGALRPTNTKIIGNCS